MSSNHVHVIHSRSPHDLPRCSNCHPGVLCGLMASYTRAVSLPMVSSFHPIPLLCFSLHQMILIGQALCLVSQQFTGVLLPPLSPPHFRQQLAVRGCRLYDSTSSIVFNTITGNSTTMLQLCT